MPNCLGHLGPGPPLSPLPHQGLLQSGRICEILPYLPGSGGRLCTGPVGGRAPAQEHCRQDTDFSRTTAYPCPGCCGVVFGDAQQYWARFLFPYALHGATNDEALGLAPGSWFIQACSGHQFVQFEHTGFALVYPSGLSPSV